MDLRGARSGYHGNVTEIKALFHLLTYNFASFGRFACFGRFGRFVSLVSLVSVVSFRWFRFGRFVSLFRVLGFSPGGHCLACGNVTLSLFLRVPFIK